MTETSISPGQDEEAAIVAAQGTHTAGEGGALGKTGFAYEPGSNGRAIRTTS